MAKFKTGDFVVLTCFSGKILFKIVDTQSCYNEEGELRSIYQVEQDIGHGYWYDEGALELNTPKTVFVPGYYRRKGSGHNPARWWDNDPTLTYPGTSYVRVKVKEIKDGT